MELIYKDTGFVPSNLISFTLILFLRLLIGAGIMLSGYRSSFK
jgi:hypothetical protein